MFFCICPCGAQSCNSEYHQGLLARRESGMWNLRREQAELGIEPERAVLSFLHGRPIYQEHAAHDSSTDSAGNATPLKLGQFRLLRILPTETTRDSDLCCSVSNFQLPSETKAVSRGTTPAYLAISYCWGEDVSTQRIRVSGQQVDIRANLYQLLTKLRSLGYRDWLWVDALCINQQDDGEKSHQIPRMGRIFDGALLTLGWLGEGVADSVNVLDRWPQLTAEVKEQYTKAVARNYKSQPRTGASDGPFALEEGFARYLIYIFGNRYWNRLWVLQETVIPKSLCLLYGDCLFSWSELHVIAGCLHYMDVFSSIKSSSALQRSAQLSGGTLRYLGELRGLYHGGLDRKSVSYMASLLQHTSSRTASYDSDHVNGILGLLDETHREAFQVDLTRSDRQTFTHFTASLLLICGSSSVNLLRRAGVREFNPKQLPSWVINFSRPASTVSLRAISEPNYRVGNIASLFPRLIFEVDPDEGKLTVAGVHKDTIDQVVAFDPNTQHFSKDVTMSLAVFGALSVCEAMALKAGIVHEECTSAIATTLSAACSVGTSNDRDGEYASWNGQMKAHITLHEKTNTCAADVALSAFGEGVAQACRGRAFFTTSSGRIGLCPKLSKGGDRLVVIPGCSTLMAVRQTPQGDYLLVGEVFCHGLNFGELAGSDKGLSSEAKTLVLV